MIEQNCTIEHEGKVFEAGGSVVTDNYIIAYMNSDMKSITTWHGEFIAPAKVTSTWRINSWISDKMHQVYAKVDGKWFTGRTTGAGMIIKMKVCK